MTIQPDVLSMYSCKCASCRRTCCRDDWDIVVSRQEYEQDCSDYFGPKCKEMAERGLCLNPLSINEDDFAKCRMRPDGHCVLLSNEELCSWQLATGHCVGRACDEFPMTTLAYCGASYRFPTVACEAVIEPLLDYDELMVLVPCEISDISMYHGPNVIINEQAITGRPLLGLYPDLIKWGMDVLQNRNLPMSQRLIILTNGLFLVDDLERSGRIRDIQSTLAQSITSTGINNVLARYDLKDSGANARITLTAHTFTTPRVLTPVNRDHSLRVLKGLGFEFDIPEAMLCSDNNSEDEIIATVDGEMLSQAILQNIRLADPQAYENKQHKLINLMERHETFFEHIAVYEFLRSLTPIVQPGVWQTAILFVAWYAIMMTSILSCSKKKMNDTQLVDIIVRTQRSIIHAGGFYADTLAWMEQVGMANPNGAAALALG